MMLDELYRVIGELSTNELEAVFQFIAHQRELRAKLDQTIDSAVNLNEDRANEPLDIDALTQIFAQLREGFSEQDLDELEWAMNVEYIEPLDDHL